MAELASMPKYESYRDLGIDWLGKLPSGWEAIRMKFLFKDTSIKNRAKETLLSVTQNQGVVPRDWVENRMVMPSGNLESFKFIEKGDFAISLRSFEGGLEYCHHDGIVSPAYTVLKAKRKNLFDGYYKYLFKSQAFISELQTSIVGIREGKNISYEELQYSLLPIPAENEQIAIANFLDQKTAQIDEAIAIKEKQIELLKERKQIVIQQAVTQGLNPNARMKNSGVDWIGDIPEHWVVSKIGHYARVYNGSTPSRDVKRYWERGNIPWMSSGKVNEYIISTPSEFITTAALRECSLRIFPIGTVLIGIVGQGKTRGTSARLAIEAAINQNVAGIIPSDRILSEFLHQFLIQAYDEVRNQGQGSNQEALNCQILSSFKVAFPSVSEQQEIVKFISSQSDKLDGSIEIQIKQIERLKEYKATLINSAVTGKIKVPDVA